MAIRTNETLLSSREVANLLDLEPITIRQYVRRHLLIPYSRVGRAFVFTKKECDRFRREKQPRGNPNFAKSAADVPASKPRRKTKTTAKA